MANVIQGRPKRDCQIQIRATVREKRLIHENADKAGVSVSQYILELCVRPLETISINNVEEGTND